MNSRNKNLYIDVHALQSVPPSCINRDDMGEPKKAYYGGVQRSRISSQAWKRSIRAYFAKLDGANHYYTGARTKNIVSMVADEIRKLDQQVDAEKLAKEAVSSAGLKLKQDKGKELTPALFFMSFAQAKALAELALKGVKEKTQYKQAIKDNPSVDMILFGRMVADDDNLNYDACVQVAHAISTHEVRNEFDYFSALDDKQADDENGAGHIDTSVFNSSTLYRYTNINVLELYKYVGEKCSEIVAEYIRSFVFSMPGGKENSYANHTLPSDIYIAVRSDQPVNLVGAFEKPIYSEREGFLIPSEKAFCTFTQKMYKYFAEKPVASWSVGEGLESLVHGIPFVDAISNLKDYIAASVTEEG